MDILQVPKQANGEHYLRKDITGESLPVNLPDKYDRFTIIISNIVGGNVRLHFSLAPLDILDKGEAIWYPSEGVANEGTTYEVSIFNKLNFLKLVPTTATTSYKFELLS